MQYTLSFLVLLSQGAHASSMRIYERRGCPGEWCGNAIDWRAVRRDTSRTNCWLHSDQRMCTLTQYTLLLWYTKCSGPLRLVSLNSILTSSCVDWTPCKSMRDNCKKALPEVRPTMLCIHYGISVVCLPGYPHLYWVVQHTLASHYQTIPWCNSTLLPQPGM